jgi:cholesterol transport system auxiliary component
MKLIIAFIVATVFLQLSACARTQVPATVMYTLTIPTFKPGSVAAESSDNILSIDVPRSMAAIMSRNILYQENQHDLNAYAYSRWSDTPNRMIANLLLARLRESGLFKVVVPVDSRAKSNYVLESMIHQFHQQVTSTDRSRVQVHMSFYLLEKNTAKVVASNELRASKLTSSVDASGGVSAFNEAVTDISQQVEIWLSTLKL